MMKRILKIGLLILALLCIIGCNENYDDTNIDIAKNTSIMTESTSIQQETTKVVENTQRETTTIELADEERGYGSVYYRTYADEDMARLGVDKKLVVISPYREIYSLGEAVVSKFNELLVNEYGCDFVVEFLGYDENDGRYTYSEALLDTQSMGQQADIIVSGYTETDYYTSLIEKGLFSDITDYLMDTREGQKLYERLPGITWDSVVYNGRIFGCTSRMGIYSACQLVCNTDVADRLGLKVEQGFSFYDIGEMLGELEDKEALEGVIGLYSRWQELPVMLGYFEITDRVMRGYGVCARKNADGEWVAFNPFLEDEFVRLCEAVREYKEKGWLVNAGELTAEEGKSLNAGDFLFYCNQVSPLNSYVGEDKIRLSEDENVHGAVPGGTWQECVWPAETSVVGIASWSEYREEALKLLTLLQTEEKLCNFLAWGVEGWDYIYENRRVVEAFPDYPETGGGGMFCQMVNQLLLYPQFTEPDDKEEYYKEIADTLEPNPFLQYGISEAEYLDAISVYNTNIELKKIYIEYYQGLLMGAFEDVDAAIAEAVKLQEDAGMNELVETINRLFEEARNE